jgi:hypothetical protein
METVTHQQIYDRLLVVETKVNEIDQNTKDLVDGFKAVQGAFTVLGWIAKAAKPILWIVGVISSIVLFWNHLLKK